MNKIPLSKTGKTLPPEIMLKIIQSLDTASFQRLMDNQKLLLKCLQYKPWWCDVPEWTPFFRSLQKYERNLCTLSRVSLLFSKEISRLVRIHYEEIPEHEDKLEKFFEDATETTEWIAGRSLTCREAAEHAGKISRARRETYSAIGFFLGRIDECANRIAKMALRA